jgi:hypothetical protein
MPNISLPGNEEEDPEEQSRAQEGRVYYPRQLSRYTSTRSDRLPIARKGEIRSEGFLGLSQNQQDLAHDRAMRGIENKVHQTDYFLQGVAALELRASKRSVDTVDAIEQDVVFQTKPGTAAAAFAEELFNDSASRLRAFQDQGLRLFIDQGTRIIEE